MYDWTDPDTGFVYRINYVVTQSDDEGPEYYEFKIKTASEWLRLPPFALDEDVAKEVNEHFHGPKIEHKYKSKYDGLTFIYADKDEDYALIEEYCGRFVALQPSHAIANSSWEVGFREVWGGWNPDGSEPDTTLLETLLLNAITVEIDIDTNGVGMYRGPANGDWEFTPDVYAIRDYVKCGEPIIMDEYILRVAPHLDGRLIQLAHNAALRVGKALAELG
jgi:hypothetical protein